MSEKQPDGLFVTALRNSRDLSERYLNRTALVTEVLGNTAAQEPRLREIVRGVVENPQHGRLGRFDSIDQRTVNKVLSWQRDGLIAAVDGSDAIRLTTLPDKLVYGVVVASVSSKSQSAPAISFTHTFQPEPAHNIDDLFRLQEELKRAAEVDSWTRSYREFRERDCAIALVAEGHELVLIDGPLYTQNLMTQAAGRQGVLANIQADPLKYIGFIKEQNPFHKHLGAALDPGEFWVFDKFREMLGATRFQKQSDGEHPAAVWVRRAKHWVRCIYKINQKAFEFECDPSLVDCGLALLLADSSPALNHEIPYLLELVDRHVRSQAEPEHIADDLINSLGQYSLTFSNERSFRK